MKINQIFVAALASTTIFASCVKDNINGLIVDEQENKIALTGDERAVQAFNNFIEQLNGEAKTRSTIIPNPKIVGIRKTNVLNYLGGKASTRSDGQDTPIYELDLLNPDYSKGYAVVGGEELMDEVFAYSPVGSIADTLYNIGLSLYFKELSMFLDSNNYNTRAADYWQPGWDYYGYGEIVDGSEELYVYITEENRYDYPTNFWAGPIDRMDITSAYVPTKWSQQPPYNQYIPAYRPGTTQKAAVGCHAVAVGQLMAYHRRPNSYNWNLISNKVAPTTTSEKNEVARLLADIAKRAGTFWISSDGSGSTYTSSTIPSLESEGYSGYQVYKGIEGGSSALIVEEIRNFNRPVLYRAELSSGSGHIWVIDAIMEHYRWFYQRASYQGYLVDPSIIGEVERYQIKRRLLHCNWGWGGESDGWFYNFDVPHNGKMYNFSECKYIFMGIEYVGFN